MKKKRNRILIILSSFLLLFIVFVLCFYPGNDARRFRKLTSSIFQSDLKADSLSLHYTLENPENYGISSYEIVMPNFKEDDYITANVSMENSIAALAKINKNKLSAEDIQTYDILTTYLKQQIAGSKFEYFEEPFSPNSGVPSQLPILLAEYRFEKKDDISNYLQLLDKIPNYLKSLQNYETNKYARGLGMPDYTIQKLVRQCNTIMNESSIESGEHFLVKTFVNRLAELEKQGIITSDEAYDYIVQNKNILIGKLVPAYRSMASFMDSMQGKGKNEGGLANVSQGKEYYAWIVQKLTGSDKTIYELQDVLLADLDTNYDELIQLSKQIASCGSDLSTCFNYTLPFDNASQITTNLQEIIQKDFPAIPTNGQELPTCEIKTLDPSLEEFSSPAFYLTPPIDSVYKNVIYLNSKNNIEPLELYTTLAHEGYPGHLYQTVFSSLYQQQIDTKPIRSVLYYGGYTEGWAYYVENMSYDFAKEVLTNEVDKDMVSLYFDATRLDRNLQVATYCLLDIAIHYNGASYEDAKNILSSLGITDEGTIQNIYQYIVEEPGTYLKYYVGYLEILEAKEYAKQTWGNAYSDLRFHTLFLETGSCTYPYLKEQIKKSNTKMS